MLARRQLEHGVSLSHFTLRLRHTTQLRDFRADVEGAIALFSGVGEMADMFVVTLSGPLRFGLFSRLCLV
jgi:hypothetical protein